MSSREMHELERRIQRLERGLEAHPLRSKGGSGPRVYEIIDAIKGPDDIGPDTGIVLEESVKYPSAPVTSVPDADPQTFDHTTISVEGLGIGQLRNTSQWVWVAQRIEKDSVVSEGVAADIPQGASAFTSGAILLERDDAPGEFYPCYLAWQL